MLKTSIIKIKQTAFLLAVQRWKLRKQKKMPNFPIPKNDTLLSWKNMTLDCFLFCRYETHDKVSLEKSIKEDPNYMVL